MSRTRSRTTTKTPTPPARTAVLYVRVSSKEQEQGFSIPAQRKLLTEYARQHSLNVLREFEDVETAKRAGRTAFTEMVEFLTATNDPQDLLVEKTDCLYRKHQGLGHDRLTPCRGAFRKEGTRFCPRNRALLKSSCTASGS